MVSEKPWWMILLKYYYIIIITLFFSDCGPGCKGLMLINGRWHVEIRILFRFLWCFALTLFLRSLFASGKTIYVFALMPDLIGDKWLKNDEMDFQDVVWVWELKHGSSFFFIHHPFKFKTLAKCFIFVRRFWSQNDQKQWISALHYSGSEGKTIERQGKGHIRMPAG